MAKVVISTTFVRQFRKLPKKDQTRIRETLVRLEEDPHKKRSGADIKKLKKTDPPKHRIRVGDLRIVYKIDGKTVRVIEVFRRRRGYRD